MASGSQPKLPVINMDDLKPGSESWMLTCDEVTRAIEEYGCFMAIYERVSKELSKEVLDSLKTLFELPTETKIKNTSDTPFYGYLGPNHTRPLFESMGIENATSLDHVQHFANLMWPSGNHHFSENIHSYASLVSDLETTVKQMVFYSYGVEKYIESYGKSSTTYLFRVNKYKPAKTGESNVATTAIHTDKSFFTILSQNHVNGLQIQTKDDEWITVEFLPSSFVVMASDVFMGEFLYTSKKGLGIPFSFHAWSNGRLRSTRHRVIMNGQEDRYSIALFTFKKGITEVPEELVDEEHPLRFKPFNHLKFIDHHSKSPIYVDERAMKSFCGYINAPKQAHSTHRKLKDSLIFFFFAYGFPATIFKQVPSGSITTAAAVVPWEQTMSRDLLSMGSKSKPPVLQIAEYPQWRFLNNIDKTLMVSIQEGPIRPYVDVPGTPETATTPAIEPRRVFKLFRHFNEVEKIRAELDEKALTLLTMAIPNDLFNRVDSRNTAKELWDELEKQFQGTERSIQAKLNQAIGAYEGFKALEGETLADSYSRFNIILNDLRRNGMQKSTSEINFKFLKNLNPEWDHYSVNLQMNKNLAEEDLPDLYSILSQHEVKVKYIVTKQKSISDSLALLTEKSKSVLSSSSKKKNHSKALVTELSDSDTETVEDASSESDVDLKRVADKLALLSSSIHKRYGKKKFYSKPKFENYKRDKYKPKEYEKRPERKTYEKGITDEKGNVCFNRGKPGHFVKDCRAPKVRDFDYYSKKAQLAKRKSEGKVLMAEEECWYDDTSDDEDSAHFTQVHYNLMASVEETINLYKETEETNEVSQTPSDSDLSDNDECSLEEQFLILKTEFDDLKEKIKFERARVIEFSNECELYKCLADDRELEKAEIRKEKAKLESQISEMKSALVNLESEKAE
ncbi:hypothetical protein OSB04_006782 [Centaurea solstitialis]|uniref:Fe2OG dioxygenase domain-containing protein n=1 Tax=Centaurea solstitialis TaxID=347529 RepID=A0AA38WHU1_9ASTR|nr:hypothetical protein OSB04_006782 [Centaurea solstitialis]